ncbi:MAG: hypothetical protein QM731_13305 [Chitinophagaceae bacterium]
MSVENPTYSIEFPFRESIHTATVTMLKDNSLVNFDDEDLRREFGSDLSFYRLSDGCGFVTPAAGCGEPYELFDTLTFILQDSEAGLSRVI